MPYKIAIRFVRVFKILLIFLVISSFFASLYWFCAQIPENTQSPGGVSPGYVLDSGDRNSLSDRKADLIVVLTGGSARIEAGIYLLQNNAAKNLFISGVGAGVKLLEVLFEAGYSKEARLRILKKKKHIILGHKARSTKQNAEEVKEWIENSKSSYASVKSIYLVTANYHMPRAILEFENLLPEVKIIPYPAFPRNFDAARWLEDLGTARLIFSEYAKYIAMWFRIYILPSELFGDS